MGRLHMSQFPSRINFCHKIRIILRSSKIKTVSFLQLLDPRRASHTSTARSEHTPRRTAGPAVASFAGFQSDGRRETTRTRPLHTPHTAHTPLGALGTAELLGSFESAHSTEVGPINAHAARASHNIARRTVSARHSRTHRNTHTHTHTHTKNNDKNCRFLILKKFEKKMAGVTGDCEDWLEAGGGGTGVVCWSCVNFISLLLILLLYRIDTVG